MKRIDVKDWFEFLIADLFEADNTGNVLARDIEDGSGVIPFVTASSVNNGVCAHINPQNYKVMPGNCILVGGKTFTLTYQKEKFISNDSHNFVLIATDKIVKKNQYLFLISVIRTAFEQRYTWNDAVTKKKILEEKIKLPVDFEKNPDWKYMDDYISDVQRKTREKLKLLNLIETRQNRKDISAWKRFHLYDLFDIDMGTKLDKVKMKDANPKIDFVGRANTNNGVTTRIDLIENVEPYKAGYMTLALGGEYLGSCFIQKNAFYTSQNVIVLIPKFEMTRNVKLFIATCIFKESRLHYKAFINELNRHVKKDFTFPLPAKQTNIPDFDYMDKYINNLCLQEKKKYDLI